MKQCKKYLFLKANACLLEFSKNPGNTYTLSDLICDAICLYLECEEYNKRNEEKQK
jgi:hypothetical protein